MDAFLRDGEIGAVGYANGQGEAADLAAVVHDLADDLAVRDDDPRTVGVPEGGGKEVDIENFAFFVGNRDVVADMEGLGENDGQSCGYVTQYALQRQRDARAGDPQAGNQGQ